MQKNVGTNEIVEEKILEKKIIQVDIIIYLLYETGIFIRVGIK